ncbi:hypothetical protein PX690_21430 [Bacillus velezensis]|uniref:hypothetical protein n=1 Tax=Bacillus velezensis TaxID=492670 RepID=UPI0023E15E39|nr:hypothetical protein [Bacillus velezensis]WES02034.1 hypothetical protein PX690_21430 [Bacillus velezensis]
MPFGAPFPKGFYAVNLSSFGVRETSPLDSESNIYLPTLLWATPFSVLGGQVQFVFVAPIAASSVRGNPSRVDNHLVFVQYLPFPCFFLFLRTTQFFFFSSLICVLSEVPTSFFVGM